MAYLLDVNVLIALLDSQHVHHRRAMGWFVAEEKDNWLTCPTTQNGAIRVLSGPTYGPTNFTPAAAMERLQLLIDETVHRFIADDVSLLDGSRINRTDFQSSRQVTDSYLLTLSVSQRIHLATMDDRLTPDPVVDSARYLFNIP